MNVTLPYPVLISRDKPGLPPYNPFIPRIKRENVAFNIIIPFFLIILERVRTSEPINYSLYPKNDDIKGRG
jgi:hypothetical protein